MSSRVALFSILVFGLAAGLAPGQVVYPSNPDWISKDTPYSTGAAFADINRDGFLDLVVSNGNDMAIEKVAVYLNRGDGTYPDQPSWQSQDSAYNGHLDVADVNGDGWPDVAVVHLLNNGAGNCAAKLYLNNSGTLSSLPDWKSSEVARSFGVAFGDVNNDGRPDLAVATGWAYNPQQAYSNYVYVNQNGQLPTTATWSSADVTTDQGALWVDADRDGWLDLAITGAKKNTRVYRNLGGTLDPNPIWNTTDNPNQDAIMMAAGDVTGDGLEDLFVTDNNQLSGGSGYFRQYDGLASGYYTTIPTWSYFEGYGSAIALADVDADGDLDAATGGWWDHTRLFMNSGTGIPANPTWSSGVTSVVEKIVFGDVDPTPDSVKRFTNRFPAAGSQQLFHLSRRHLQEVLSVTLDGQALTPDRYTLHREWGWITVDTAPASELVVTFTWSDSLDMAVANWDSSKGNYLYYNLSDPSWLTASATQISISVGGSVDFELDAGPENAGRGYLVFGGVSGTTPGTPLPGGMAVLPVNWDVFTNIVLSLAGTPVFDRFLGTLNGNGEASAKLDTLGPVSGAAGITLSFAYALAAPFDFASNPVEVDLVP